MKKIFSLPPTRTFPKHWINAPCISPLYSPKELGNIHFVLMKAPLHPKMLENLPRDLHWTSQIAIGKVRTIMPPDSFFIVINLSKKNNSVSQSEWISQGIQYEECRIVWKDPKQSISRLVDILHKYRPQPPKQLVVALLSGTSLNKTVFAAAAAVCYNQFSILGGVLSTLMTIHPPGILNKKVITGLSRYFEREVPFAMELEKPTWYEPFSSQDTQDAPKGPIPLVKVTYPGLQEIGATQGSKNDLTQVRKLLSECDRSYGSGRITGAHQHVVWEENKLQVIEREKYRVTFQPDGDDVLLVMFEKNYGFLLNSCGELYNIPLRTKSEVPLVLAGVLQKKYGGSFIFFVTDILLYGNILFRDDSYDTRLSFIWNFVVGSLSSRPTPPRIDFVMRSCALLKDAKRVYDNISKQYFRCTGIAFVPQNSLPPAPSIFLPVGECLVPLQAIANSGNTIILYAMDEQTGEHVPVGISKVTKELIQVDGMTVYADYSAKSKNWVIKKYSRDMQTVQVSYATGISRYRDNDPLQPQEILKIVGERCKAQDNN